MRPGMMTGHGHARFRSTARRAIARSAARRYCGRTMARTVAQPTQLGVHEGRPYMLWLPHSKAPWPGMVILHGAGSRKENHGEFGRACAASGWAAISFDQRGHGESQDGMGPAAR